MTSYEPSSSHTNQNSDAASFATKLVNVKFRSITSRAPVIASAINVYETKNHSGQFSLAPVSNIMSAHAGHACTHNA